MNKNPDTCTATLVEQPDGSIACPECGLKIVLPVRSVKQGKPTKEDAAFNAGVEAAALVAESATLLFLSGSRKAVESLPEQIRQLKK